MRVVFAMWLVGALSVGVGCAQRDAISTQQLAITGDPCPDAWYAAMPPDPSWNFPPTLGQMLPIDYNDTESVTAVFGVPAVKLESLLPPGVAPFEFVPGLGGVSVSISNNRSFSGPDPQYSTLDPYRELTVSIPVVDPSLEDGFLPIFQSSMVVTSEQARWGGIAGWGFPKIIGNTHCREVKPKGLKCMASADDQLIVKVEVKTDDMAALASTPLLFVSVKDGYLVRTAWSGSGVNYTHYDVPTGQPGATIQLGDHPIGQQLRALGLESAPPLVEYWAPHVSGAQLDRGLCTRLP